MSYFLSSITGKAKRVIITTDAPIIPVVAAIIVPIIVTDKASPPGTVLNKICNAYNKSLATPDFSNIVPININIGIATNIKFSQTPPHILDRILKNSIRLNTSKYIPIKP